MHIGIEANYELGLTDTYGKKEKEGSAYSKVFFPVYNITGTRKFSGLEVMATVSVPLSIFKSSGQKTHKAAIVEVPTTHQTGTRITEKPCYTLEEILAFVKRGENVKGKTICAVEQINFDYNKSTISNNSYTYLNKIATFLINTNNRVEIKGHTDRCGLLSCKQSWRITKYSTIQQHGGTQGETTSRVLVACVRNALRRES